MATVNFKLRRKSGLANIYVRVVHGRNFDKETPIGTFIDANHWDKKNQRVRNLMDAPDGRKINAKLLMLEAFIISEINEAGFVGETLTLKWLQKTINKHFTRQTQTKGVFLNRTIYYSDFNKYWLDEKALQYTVNTGCLMEEKKRKEYLRTANCVKDFEAEFEKILFSEVDIELIRTIARWLVNKKNYQSSTAGAIIMQIKFLLERAEGEGIKLNPTYKSDKVVIPKSGQKSQFIYLTPAEIQSIVTHDFSHDKELDHTRDMFVIGLHTGLRVSDFLGNWLKAPAPNEETMSCYNKKTDLWVQLPIHDDVRAVFKKHNGKPKKMSKSQFGTSIKLVCKEVGMTEEIKGKVFQKGDEDTNAKSEWRKKEKVYKKYELITTHICRRSFATNLHGRLPEQEIADLGGWSKLETMRNYIQKTGLDSGKGLKALYDKEREEKLIKANATRKATKEKV